MLEKVVRYYTPGGLHAGVEGGKGGGGGRGISNSVQSPRRFRLFTIKAGVFIPHRGNRTPVMYPQKCAYCCSHFDPLCL